LTHNVSHSNLAGGRNGRHGCSLLRVGRLLRQRREVRSNSPFQSETKKSLATFVTRLAEQVDYFPLRLAYFLRAMTVTVENSGRSSALRESALRDR
jgi:hypothetical protein